MATPSESADSLIIYSEQKSQNHGNHRHHHHHRHRQHHHHHRVHQRTPPAAHENVSTILRRNNWFGNGNSCDLHHSPQQVGVSMATQVISPTAIGGSLKIGERRKLCEPYYPDLETEEDEVGLFGRRRRVPWGKLSCYALATGTLLLVLTGVVLAVGYMQSEKHRILSQAQRFQAANLTATTWRPFIRYERLPIVSQVLTPPPPPPRIRPDLPEDPLVPEKDGQQDGSDESSTESDEDDEDSKGLEIYEIPENGLSALPSSSSRKTEETPSPVEEEEEEEATISSTFILPLNNNKDAEPAAAAVDPHRSPAEVKVLPPKGFTFNGFSFEIPIYNSTGDNNKGSNNKNNNDNSFSLYPTTSTTATTSTTSQVPPKSLQHSQPDLDPTTQEDQPDNLHLKSTSQSDEDAKPNQDAHPLNANFEIIEPSKLTTDLFANDDKEYADGDANKLHPDELDSEMSASSSRRGTARKIEPTDNMYTPRPGTTPFYPDRPKFSSNFNDKTTQFDKFSSNRSEVRVPPPEVTTTATTTTPKPDDQSHFNGNSLHSAGKFETTTNSPFVEYQIGTPATFSSDVVTPNPFIITTLAPTNFEFDFSQLTTPAPATPSFDIPQIPNAAISKRTFNFDFDTAAATNPFANILGGQGDLTGVIGSATSTGATLGLQNPYYNFDNSFNFQSLPPTNLNLPSGTVPLDLARSYIQVGNPKGSDGGGGQSLDYTTAYSNNNPTLALGPFGQHGGNDYPTLTTSAGNPNPPSYNTITQGIHLLSLLSGSIPHHLVDSQASSSNDFGQLANKPEFQIAALAGYGGSGAGFLNENSPGLSANTQIGGSSSNLQNSYTFASPDLYQSKSYPSANNDQEASFSHNIISKLADFNKIHQSKEPIGDSLPSASEISESRKSSPEIATPVAAHDKLISQVLKLPGKGHDMGTAGSSKVQEYVNLIPDKPRINFAKRVRDNKGVKPGTEGLDPPGAKGLS